MKPRQFLSQLEHDRIVAAIAEAEKRCSGEIRVSVSHGPVQDALAEATREFARLGMHETELRNGVLIFVAPRSQTFSIFGDNAIHAKCGDAFWKAVAAEMESLFKQGKFTEGIVQAVRKAGELLAEHFPRKPDDRNELPDAVVEQ